MEKLSKEEIDYWLFSNELDVRLLRARNELRMEKVTTGVTQEQAAEMCAKIREHLEDDVFYEIYVKLLVFYNDTSALDVLCRKLQCFKEQKRYNICNPSIEIRLLKDAIRHLKRVERSSRQGFWAKIISRLRG